MKWTREIPADLTVVILAGGFGTRLRSAVSDRPKVLADVAGRPFLEWWLRALDKRGARRIVICTGYMADAVEKTFGHHYGDAELIYSVEETPLGTGGAVRNALREVHSETVMVLNGDSYCEPCLGSFVESHVNRAAAASLVIAKVDETERYGRVTLRGDRRIEEFKEKSGTSGPGWINAGIYCIQRSLLEIMPEGIAISMERDLLPDWIAGRVYGFATASPFIDIGTPESYASASSFFQHMSPRLSEDLDLGSFAFAG